MAEQGKGKRASNGASQTGQLVCAQVEYYFSDENLYRDKFFSDLIARDSAGWVSLAPIMRCNKINEFNISEDEVLEAVQASEWLEIKNRHIRRRIPFEPRHSHKGEGREGENPKGKGKGGKGKGKGNSQDQMARAAPVVDPSGPCGYFMAGYCNHGDLLLDTAFSALSQGHQTRVAESGRSECQKGPPISCRQNSG